MKFYCIVRQKESRGVVSGGVVAGLVVELVVLDVVVSEATDLKHTIKMVARTTVMLQRNIMPTMIIPRMLKVLLTMIIPRMLKVLLTMIFPRMLNMLRATARKTEFQSCLKLIMIMSITMMQLQKNLTLPTVKLKVKRMHQDLFQEESLNATNHVRRVTLRLL
jgi:hypothetical protein